MNISEEVFKYVYGEMTREEKVRFEQRLFPGSNLVEEVEQLLSLKKQIDNVPKHYQPRKKTLDNILEFSRTYKKQSISEKKTSSS